MPMISNLKYTGLTLDPKYGLIIQVQGDAPPGAARSLSHNKRKEYWEQGKRLQMGGLVAIVTKARNKEATVSLALLTTCKSSYPSTTKVMMLIRQIPATSNMLRTGALPPFNSASRSSIPLKASWLPKSYNVEKPMTDETSTSCWKVQSFTRRIDHSWRPYKVWIQIDCLWRIT